MLPADGPADGYAIAEDAERSKDLDYLSPHRQTLSIDQMERLHLTIEGMTCEHCVRAVRGRLEKTAGVKVGDVQVGSATLEYDPARTDVEQIEDAIADEGYTAFVSE
jgi:copper chaperone CopZ